jgi:NADPH-dependent curcumin reductase CurA
MATRQREVHLIDYPDGLPTIADFRVVETTVADPAQGQVLIKNLYMSVDPAMRPRLAVGQQRLNEAMGGGAIGIVAASRNPNFKDGDLVQHQAAFREYHLSDGKGIRPLPAGDVAPTLYMHVLGGTGMTAYGGLLVTGALKNGENVFVSAAAGAVGSVAVQIAKIKNCYTIGSAGSQAKCDWLTNDLGIDVAINYKEGSLRKNLKDAAPNGIDVYFENVGGDHLDAALPRMNPLGRIPVCGMISAYNTPGARSTGVTTLSNMIYNRLTMKGFVVYEFEHLREQFLSDMKGWIKDGRMKYHETIVDGIDNAPRALIGLFTGENTGKMLVRLGQ